MPVDLNMCWPVGTDVSQVDVGASQLTWCYVGADRLNVQQTGYMKPTFLPWIWLERLMMDIHVWHRVTLVCAWQDSWILDMLDGERWCLKLMLETDISKIYNEVMSKIKAKLSTAKWVALTCDAWTSQATQYNVTLTAAPIHYFFLTINPTVLFFQLIDLPNLSIIMIIILKKNRNTFRNSL